MNIYTHHHYLKFKYFVIILLLLIGVIGGICAFKKLKLSENGYESDNFYQKLTDGKDINILVVGDSIGKGSGASSADKSWDSLLSTLLNKKYNVNCKITNISMGGNSSYAGYVRTMELYDNVDYDLAIICYGQNDKKENLSLYYESIIRAIQRKYKNCEIISVLESSQKKYTTKIQQIQQLDNYYGIPIADTIASFKNSGINYEKLSDDGIHPSDEGHKIYAKTIEDVISYKLESGNSYVQYNLYPYNKDVIKFDTFKYIPVAKFTRINKTTFEIQMEDISGILGIDYSFESGNNIANIYIDNQLFAAPTISFNYDFSQRHIIIVKNDCKVESNISIEFGSTKQADDFQGIIFSDIGS